MSFLKVEGIGLQEEESLILQDISFTQQEFQKIAIAGETGSGKSTLLKILAGLVQPTAGQVLFEQERVLGPQEKLVAGHPHIAYLSQHFELQKFLRVEQILTYANTLPRDEAEAIYAVCRISHLLKRRTDHLSGGEKQRIALARLLVTAPSLLLLDEPFSNLDMSHKRTLKEVIREMGEQLDITCILTSHDPLDTLAWADEILVLHSGRIIQKGTPAQVYRHPVNEYTAALFGNYNLLPAAFATAFPGVRSAGAKGRHLLVRPEAFTLETEAGSHTIKGSVKAVHYLGSYYDVEVLSEALPGEVISVKTTNGRHLPGDAVHLALSSQDVWYI
ncbi:ABC transporter ATP-binding protein [Pontibacter liquoris]|uniref:ABC transporter ATP-binding protein n=1 Tax=Pontibacter liquoris TaxID=2905677 RepID=UPI001FA7C49B|nr:ABC transporter ATP-binding protein [Pontibacter liquoris]